MVLFAVSRWSITVIRGQPRPTLQYRQSPIIRSWRLGMAIQALILERNPLHRRLLIEFLRRQPGMALVGIAATLEEAVAFCRSRRPNLVVASLGPALRQGLETIRTLRENLPQAQILVLLDVDDERYRQAALSQGATFCVAKTALRGKLGSALQSLQREEIATSSDRP